MPRTPFPMCVFFFFWKMSPKNLVDFRYAKMRPTQKLTMWKLLVGTGGSARQTWVQVWWIIVTLGLVRRYLIGKRRLFGKMVTNASLQSILAARIPFFQDLFNSNMSECSSGVVDFSKFRYETLVSLVQYATTGRIRIVDMELPDLLLGAHFLQMVRMLFAIIESVCLGCSAKRWQR